MSTLKNIEPLGLSYQDIQQIAEKIAQKTKVREIEDYSMLISGLGGKIVYEEHSAWENPAAVSQRIFAPSEFEVFLPKNASITLNNVVLASALAYYFLHSLEGKVPMSIPRFEKNHAHLEGLWFSLALLMPDAQFAFSCKNAKSTDEQLAKIFKVPQELVALKRKILTQNHIL